MCDKQRSAASNKLGQGSRKERGKGMSEETQEESIQEQKARTETEMESHLMSFSLLVESVTSNILKEQLSKSTRNRYKRNQKLRKREDETKRQDSCPSSDGKDG